MGFGNRTRRDDAAGLVVVDRLQHTDALEATTDLLSMLETWEPYDRVVLVDAMLSDAPAGTTVWIDASAAPPPRIGFRTTHDIGPLEAVGLARALGRLPRKVELVGIEAERVDAGAGLSEPIEQAVHALVERIDHA